MEEAYTFQAFKFPARIENSMSARFIEISRALPGSSMFRPNISLAYT